MPHGLVLAEHGKKRLQAQITGDGAKQLEEMRQRLAKTSDAKEKAALRGLIAQGADVIIPGEAPLCVLLASQRITDIDGVPVMDSLAAWIKDAEKLVDLRRQSGIRASIRGYFHEPPQRERLKELAHFYGLDKFRHSK